MLFVGDTELCGCHNCFVGCNNCLSGVSVELFTTYKSNVGNAESVRALINL